MKRTGSWTIAVALGIVSGVLAQNGQGHPANPVFRELCEQGLAIGDKIVVRLPPPVMVDGLDRAAQQAVLKKLAPRELDDFVRDSVVAGHVLQLREIKPSDPKAPAHGVDIYFVAYGALKKLSDKEFQKRLWSADPDEGSGKSLSAQDLAKRKIAILPAHEKHEGYGHAVLALFDKVEIRAAGRSFWSESGDSILVAGLIDPRFAGDAEFPNQWRTMKKNGKVELGPAHSYGGAGYYLKVTRLHEPQGALFVEGHFVFTEPTGWFDGANFLRSKLPVSIQSQVRAIRRELKRAGP